MNSDFHRTKQIVFMKPRRLRSFNKNRLDSNKTLNNRWSSDEIKSFDTAKQIYRDARKCKMSDLQVYLIGYLINL